MAADQSDTIWIETERFADYGGWTLDSQFVDQMGSSYLLAASWTGPVGDAVTTARVPKPGSYRLWVRCRDWAPEHSPGRFAVAINGKRSDTEFGASKQPHWLWEDGGVFELPAGDVELRLKDLAGQYGRCCALVLSADPDFTPPAGLDELREVRRRLTGAGTQVQDAGKFDFVVVGGGLAGTSAAIAAARHGSKVALIQNRPVLGGNASSEIRVGPGGASAGGGNKNARETGIMEEITLERHHLDNWDQACRKLVDAEPNLSLFLNTHVNAVEMADATTIAAVEGVNVVTGQRLRFAGDLFADCTGDACVGYLAGAEYRVGREGSDEFGESIAPAEPDRKTLGSSIMFASRDAGRPAPFQPPDWARVFDSCDDLPHRNHSSHSFGYWWIEWGGEKDTIADAELIRDELLRALYGLWDHMKNRCRHRDNFTNRELQWVGYVAGKRESRRLVGDYMLTQQDVQTQWLFEDRVAYGGWSIDLHPPKGIYDPEPPASFARGPIYSIPYRCLYSRNIGNLFMAGRDASMSHVAFGSTRLMRTCAVSGQAVGTAAAMCRRYRTTPRGIYQDHIGELQQLLLKDDCFIIDLPNQDEHDLARRAEVAASSTMATGPFTRDHVRAVKVHNLDHDRAQMFTASGDRIVGLSLLLESKLDEAREVAVHVCSAAELGDFDGGEELETTTASVPPDGRHWVDVTVDLRPGPEAVYWVWLPKTEGLGWCLMEPAPSAAVRAYRGGDGKWRPMPDHYALIVSPPLEQPGLYSPENVVNGIARVRDGATNMWASDPEMALPQWLELDFGEPTKFDTVYLTFDTNLTGREPPTGDVPQCVRDYRLLVPEGDGWRELASVQGNYQRRRIHRFPAVTAQKLRLEVLATHGDKSARVFEVRVYDEAVP
ncbi:MAG: FAD-dependent oxidoreductase [Armatimonadota bacterium]